MHTSIVSSLSSAYQDAYGPHHRFSRANLDQDLLSQPAACMDACKRLIRVVSWEELLALVEPLPCQIF